MANNFLFDLIAPLYDHIINEKDKDALLEPLALPAEGWLLDAGGGTGRASAGLAGQVEHMVIADLSFSMLLSAKERGITNLVQASSTALPFPAETFSRVMVIDALHHMDDQPKSVAALLHVLKPDGRLLIEEPDIRVFAVKLIALGEKLLLMRSHIHTPSEIEGFARAAGAQTRLDSDGAGSAWIIAEIGS